jgi:hypothetical protein
MTELHILWTLVLICNPSRLMVDRKVFPGGYFYDHFYDHFFQIIFFGLFFSDYFFPIFFRLFFSFFFPAIFPTIFANVQVIFAEIGRTALKNGPMWLTYWIEKWARYG